MKVIRSRVLWLCVPFMAAVSLTAMGQKVTPPKSLPQPGAPKISAEQQDAIDLLRGLALNLKSEFDKPAAAALQARIADSVWAFDEPYARDVFRWSFDAARQPAPDDLPRAQQAAYSTRQAAAIKDVLARFSAHDRPRAEAWLKSLEEEKLAADTNSKSNGLQSELLMEVALQMVTSNPQQAQRLGLLSLSDSQIPDSFGRLLFALANVNRDLSDGLLRGAVGALRRHEFVYDSSLVTLSNYLFGPSGELRSDARLEDAQLLTNYFVDAAWHQITSPGDPLTDASASFLSFLEVRGTPIVARNNPSRLSELQGQLHQMALGMSQEQAQRTAALSLAQDQQKTISDRNRYDIDEQIDRAQRVTDSRVRDSLFNNIAHSLMRQDTARALKIAAMIEDEEQRKPVEDDINLLAIQTELSARFYKEARSTALLLNNFSLRCKVLVELAARALSENTDAARAGELLAEACEINSKAENNADKAVDYLTIAQRFASFDSIRSFECLTMAIKTINQLKADEPPQRTATAKTPLLRIKTYTVINGHEMSASDRSTPESIDFHQIAPLIGEDYMQTRLLANTLEKSLWRAKYLTAVGITRLTTAPTRPSTALNKKGLPGVP